MDKNIMCSNGKFHFHKGHYLANDIVNSLCNVKNEEYPKIQCQDTDEICCHYKDAYVFLHGSCQLFALALHENFGYEVYEIRNNQGVMVHTFCLADYKGQVVYVDIRGVTTNIVECMSEFPALYSGYSIDKHNIEEDRRLEIEGEEIGYQFAQSIIQQYPKYYDAAL